MRLTHSLAGAKDSEHKSDLVPPVGTASALDQEVPAEPSIISFTPNTQNASPSTKDSFSSNNQDPVFANLNISTQAVAGTPAPARDSSTPTPNLTSDFNPITDIVPDKGVNKDTPASDFKEQTIDSNNALVTPNTSTSSSILPKSTGDAEKPLPASPAPPVPQLGVRDHPLPPIANQESKHLMGDEIVVCWFTLIS